MSVNDPKRKSWVEVEKDSDFPIQNLPFGVFRTQDNPTPRVCTAIGKNVVDLAAMSYLGFFDELKTGSEVFSNRYLNDLMALGKSKTSALRSRIAELLDERNTGARELSWHFLHPIEKVEMLLPVHIGDYTDFYSSLEHATNVGSLFRPDNPLLPNWKHLPVGYHGRSSSIVVSGTSVHRPLGQFKMPDVAQPVFGPTRLLDFELEMAFVVSRPTFLGQRVTTDEAEDYIFGLMLFNDWSARDIQSWEYVPLGPFLGKNFASTISPWVVTLEALEPLRTAGPEQDPQPLEYLRFQGHRSFDIHLEAQIQPQGSSPFTVCRSNFKYMYWNICQQLAHHTVGGCNLNVGDLCASGTISGPTPGSFGSMLELTWRGTRPLRLPDGSERKFIEDGDTVILRGWGEKDGVRIGFGEAAGKVLPPL